MEKIRTKKLLDDISYQDQYLDDIIKIINKLGMENVSLSDYYSEISKIRTRILSKYTHEDDIKPQELKRQTDTKSYCHLDLKQLENHAQRKPLLPKEDNHNVDDRVKKLDSMNDRIKDVLSQRRSPVPINLSAQKKTTISKTLQSNFGVKEGKIPFLKRVVSQVQNENNIIESQVIHTKTYEASRATFGKDSQGLESECRVFKDKQSYQDQEREKKSQFSFSNKTSSRQDLDTVKKQAIDMSLQDFRQKYMVSIPSLTDPSIKNNKETPVTHKDHKNQKGIQSIFQSLPHPKASQLGKPYQKQAVANSINGKTNESKKLVQLLVKQVNFDIKLRDLKEQFQHFNNKQKWSLLKQQLAKINASMPQFELELWTKISPEQYNPFNACVNNSTLSITQLAKRLLQAKQCWQKSLRQSVSISKLEDEQFSIRELDLGGKGYLTIEDLVCFINLNSDSYLRNRDVFSMFKRWCKIQGQDSLSRDCRIRYETFLNYVTS